MSRCFDTIVLGGDADGLTAAICLARGGSKVLLLESADTLGGIMREIEFSPGFRVAPLASDAGYVDARWLRQVGLAPFAQETPPNASVVALGDDEPLQLYRDTARTAYVLERLSGKDARRWPDFARQLWRLAGFLGALYRRPAPRMVPHRFTDAIELTRLVSGFRSLGASGMVELMRVLPMSAADWLDDWFESTPLKGLLAALAVTDTPRGPMSGGTVFTLLHRHIGGREGVFAERMRLRAGAGALIKALAERARALGVVIETSATVHRTIVKETHVAGVVMSSGEQIGCRHFISTLDPTHSLLHLLGAEHLDVETVKSAQHIRYRGVTTKILLALDALPPTSFSLSASIVIAPSIRYVERAYDAVKYGGSSEEPVLELRFPSVTQAKLAPSGKHVAVLHVQYTPYALRQGNWNAMRERIADRAIALAERHLPGLSDRIRARSILAPPDLQAQFALKEGAVSQGELMLDQILSMRPIPGWSRYATPVPGFYLCGAGTHPGPGITGVSGWLAARAIQSRRR